MKPNSSRHIVLLTLFWNLLTADQVEHAHDNPLDEITLGECDVMETLTLDDKPAGGKMNLEIDKGPEVKSEMENDSQVEAKKTKKKREKKEKFKGEKGAKTQNLI